jgi:hypothetical protein
LGNADRATAQSAAAIAAPAGSRVKPRPSDHDSPRSTFDLDRGWYLLAVEIWNADYEQLRQEFSHVFDFLDFVHETAEKLIRSASEN